MIRPWTKRTPVALFVSLLFANPTAYAQADDVASKPAEEEETAPEPSKADTKAAAAVTASADATPAPAAKPAAAAKAEGDPPESFGVAPGASRCHAEPIHQGDHPEYKDHS